MTTQSDSCSYMNYIRLMESKNMGVFMIWPRSFVKITVPSTIINKGYKYIYITKDCIKIT